MYKEYIQVKNEQYIPILAMYNISCHSSIGGILKLSDTLITLNEDAHMPTRPAFTTL
jgi:hypothetical protein